MRRISTTSRDAHREAAVEVGLTVALGETESSRAGTVCETRGLTWKGMMWMHTRGMMGFAARGFRRIKADETLGPQRHDQEQLGC